MQTGNLFATGLVAGGSLMGVIFAFLGVNEFIAGKLDKISLQGWLTNLLSQDGYMLLGAFLFGMMAWILYKTAMKKSET